MAILTLSERITLLAELKQKFAPCYRLKARDLDQLVDIISCINQDYSGASGTGDGNDFLTSFSLVGNTLTAIIPNQPSISVDLSYIGNANQTISLLGDVLTLSDGGSVILPSGGGTNTFSVLNDRVITFENNDTIEVPKLLTVSSTGTDLGTTPNVNNANRITFTDGFSLFENSAFGNIGAELHLNLTNVPLPFIPIGDITSTTVQGAIQELQTTVGNLDTGVQSVVAGSNITIDNTDPNNPIISSTGTGKGSLPAPTVNASILQNVSGTFVEVLEKTVTFLGSDLSLNNGDNQRVLTLADTILTEDNGYTLGVFVSGQRRFKTFDYTMIGDNQIRFELPLDDADNIHVIYRVQSDTIAVTTTTNRILGIVG